MGFDRPNRGIFRLLRHMRIILDRLYLLVLADRRFRGIALIFTAAAGNKWQQAEQSSKAVDCRFYGVFQLP